MSDDNQQPQQQHGSDIPLELLKEIDKQYPDGVTVRVQRRDFKGRFNVLTGGAAATETHRLVKDCAQPEGWLYEFAGGGQYELQLFDPDNPLKILARYKVSVEGKERVPGSATRERRPQHGSGELAPQRPVYVTPSSGGDDDDGRALGLYSETTDREIQRLNKALEEQKHQTGALHERLDRERRDNETRLEREREERRAAELERKESEHKHQMELLKAEVLAIRSGSSSSKLDIVGLAAALAPAAAGLLAWLGSAKDRDLKHLELMLSSVNKKDGGDDSIKLFTETILPIIRESAQQKSPEAMARLVEAMADVQQTSMAQLSQMISIAASEQPDNPWYQIVDKGVAALTKIAQEMGETVRDSVASPRQLPPGSEPDPDQITDAIMRASNLPKDLATPTWRKFFRRIHARDDVTAVARDLAVHLEDLGEQQLPQLFQGLLNSDEPASTFLERLLSNLPIATMDKAYVRRLLVAFDDAFDVAPHEAPEEGTEEIIDASPQPA